MVVGILRLQAAVESWFSHGNGDAFLFDEVLLAAADGVYNIRVPAAWKIECVGSVGPTDIDLCQRRGCRPEAEHGGESRGEAPGSGRTA